MVLTTQFSDFMKLNLEMDKKLNIKATQGQYSKGKLLAGNAKRKSAFERNLEPAGYCWTYGFKATKWHISQKCSTLEAGHQRTATQQNIIGGKEGGK